ncbi:hypothetical protein ILUMI_01570 [Ignelater luminosus]|uniref:Reverse transcriptase/retrotransposon-derived protein RNase H-like domain-containing protein n=1 Tax=Ignelater luminosus TaxID=2038154 RepID=A0A8K0DK03_IGNLU|nr:hypothetical protein ILUMI_01570 [Ignelater luminosus]
MGHQITVNGFSPDESKIKAILEMPPPTNKKELQRKIIAWYWNEDKQKAIDYLKTILTSKPVLQYYDVNKPCILSADASKDGLAAVLLQNKMPCAYASKAMTGAQKRYAQIEKELLAILFACEHFHQYIYGKHVVQTDHKPLVAIFNKPLVSASLRLQRMLMKIQRYDIELHYVPGKYLYLAYTLSRATSTNNTITESEDKFDEEVEAHVGLLRMHLNASSHKVMEIQKATSEDALEDSTSSNQVIMHLKSIFARHGIPDVVMSDNAKQANSDMYLVLSPAQLLMARTLRDTLSINELLLIPRTPNKNLVKDALQKRQENQRYYYKRGTKPLNPLKHRQKIYVKTQLKDKEWRPATIENRKEQPRLYMFNNSEGD